MHDLLNKLANLVTPILLRSRLHFLMSANILLITFTGRKSRKVYSTPVEYMREGDCLTVFTQRKRTWWRNLQGGASVTVRLRGRDINGEAQTITDSAAISATFHRMHPKIRLSSDFAANCVMIQIGLREAVERDGMSRS